MSRALILLASVIVYAFFLMVFLYLIGFTGDLVVPKSVDSGSDVIAEWDDILVNVGLIALFGFSHSAMARQGFKKAITQAVPWALERSFFVLVASLVLFTMMMGWRPMPAVIWHVEGVGANILWGIFALGWALVLLSTFLINHFELFGLRQAWCEFRGTEIPAPRFRTPMLYKHVRHPLYFGFLLGMWAMPHMTSGHLLFAAGMTLYILFGIVCEEQDLLKLFGERYRQYMAEVPMLIPFLPAGGSGTEEGVEDAADSTLAPEPTPETTETVQNPPSEFRKQD